VFRSATFDAVAVSGPIASHGMAIMLVREYPSHLGLDARRNRPTSFREKWPARDKGDLEAAIRELKAERDGEIEVAGPGLAQSLTERGLIDEYRIYLLPVVLGHDKPYFAGPRPPLRLMTNDRIGEDVIRLTYVPA
jgi:riboflavin biosynthesis pyrimidine reductase